MENLDLQGETEQKYVKGAEIQGVGIVLVGDFNPKIFQPLWFSAEQLIRQQEAESAKIEIIHPDVTIFTLEWLRFEVTRERLSAVTTQEPYFEILRDLVLGTFRLLRHTPVRAMGINKDMHVRMKSEEEWHNFGHILAPKKIWADLLEKPGVRHLIMEGLRTDGYKGFIRVQIQPSARIRPGVFFEVNDHYEVKDPNALLARVS